MCSETNGQNVLFRLSHIFFPKVFKYVCSHVIGRLVLKVWISRSNYHVIAPPHYILPGIDLQPFASTVTRVRPRFFDQVGHETMYVFSGNKHFFTKSCHRLIYQNYEQPPQTSQNFDVQSHFSLLKIGRIFLKNKFCEEYWTRRPIPIKRFF